MKKLFMYAAIAALGLGAASCDKGPGNDNGPKGNGSETGMRISVVMPQGSGNTRATNWGSIAANDDENEMFTLDVYVFDADGKAATFGSHTPVDDFDARFSDGDGDGVWTSATPFDAIAGEGVKVYVGANLPAAFRTKTFGTEALMLAEYEALAELSGDLDTEGIDMFSDLAEVDLEAIPVGETFDQQDDEFNDVEIDLFRVVSKSASSVDWTTEGTSNKVTWANGSGVVLEYIPTHWRVMQYATESWVAPHYNVLKYNTNVANTTRPATYYRPDVTDPSFVAGNIAGYDVSVGAPADSGTATERLFVDWDDAGDDEKLTDAAATYYKYIGENSRVGAANALNKNTTYAFISTGVKVNKAAHWDRTTGGVVYENVTDGYGRISTDDAQNKDVFLIRYDNIEYVTDSLTTVSSIAQGFAGPLNVIIAATTPTVPEPGITYMTMAEFQAAYDFEVYTFYKGYVHFQYWINGYPQAGQNNYEVLRNQFIHLSLTGINQDNATNSTFPGYPGDSTYPRKPIDPNITIPNNPDPREPEDPVDPTKTQIDVLVKIYDWTYRKNEMVVGR